MLHEQTSIRAVIFDYDGTLVRLNIDFSRMRQDVEKVLILYGIEPAALEGSYVLEIIDEAAARISEENFTKGLTFRQTALEIVIEHEIRAAKYGTKLPGVPRILKKLREKNIKVGVITRNCDEAVKMIFPDIDSYCDAFFPRDCVSRVKPHPNHLTMVLEALHVRDPMLCLMVGDHLMDIEAGKRLHMKTAGVLTGKIDRRAFMKAGADYILKDVTAVDDILFGGTA